MQSVHHQSAMLPPTETELTQTHTLTKLASRWDRVINRELHRFAKFLWPNTRLLGLVPIQNYRLRKRRDFGTVVWWVEHDIPPFDCYRCEAYRVELSLTASGQPRLVVRSGLSAYPVVPISLEGIKTALVRAGADTPLLIRRQFGPALDP